MQQSLHCGTAASKNRHLRMHKTFCVNTVCIYKAREEHTHEMMKVMFLKFWKTRCRNRNLFSYAYVIRNLTTCNFHVVRIVIKSPMMSRYRLSNEKCKFGILLPSDAGSHKSMVRSGCHGKVFVIEACCRTNIFLPLGLFLSFIVEQTHDAT